MSLVRGRGVPFLMGGVVGAVSSYFLDPERGRGRRARTRDQVAAGFRRGGRRAAQAGRRTGAAAYGTWQRTIHRRPAEPYPDDQTLAHKVESELFADRSVPKGQININVEEGVVVLRGQVEQSGQIQELEKRVRAIDGVRDVRSLLHLPGTPAPNKAEVTDLT